MVIVALACTSLCAFAAPPQQIKTGQDLLTAMHAHPRLIERPIFVHGGRAVLGRPPERVLDLLQSAG